MNTKNIVSLNDIKHDLLKIMNPHDGYLIAGNPQPVKRLFLSYLNDLQEKKTIYDFSIDTSNRDNAITFDINIRITSFRTHKKLKIHVGTYGDNT